MTPAPYYADDSVTLYLGDCLDVLAGMGAGTVDAVVTDPPYGLEFMGKEWDAPWRPSSVGRGVAVAAERAAELTPRGRGHTTSGGAYLAAGVDSVRVAGKPFQDWCATWTAECLRVLKPGGYLLAFGGSRTWHRLAAAVEDAGFEIRDSIAWLYGSGFPKSLNIGDGRGTALKPAFEPIVVGRKPLAGTVAANVLTHGTGALNIDACRVGMSDTDRESARVPMGQWALSNTTTGGTPARSGSTFEPAAAGRWPTNVVLDDTQAAALDEQTGATQSRIGKPRGAASGDGWGMTATGAEYDDAGGASRFFPTFHYEPKAPQSERPRDGDTAHPTVKPLDLMRWLVRLVTPPGRLVLDPFLGSGTTAEACIVEGFRCIGIEREPAYLPLAVARLSKPIAPVLDFGEASA